MGLLQEQITEARQTIKSDSYAMSVGEVANLYSNGEIVIRPEFQRLFRWSSSQKSRLIESILLGIPLPTIFVMQRDDSVWEVIDGLQRLSTILEFMGELRSPEGEIMPPSTLKGTEYLSALEGLQYKNDENEGASLDEAQRIAIRRAKLNVTILLPESDDKAKGELFDRLNAGGSVATPQEIRMAQFVMRDADFARWLTALKDHPQFRTITPLSDRLISEGYDTELVCRFLVLDRASNEDLGDLDNIDEFLTAKSYAILEDADYDRTANAEKFKAICDLLAGVLDEDAFKRFDSSADRFKGAFSVSAFEVLMTGVGANLDYWQTHREDLRDKVASIWGESQFTGRSGSGKSSKDRIPHTVPWAREYFGM